MTEISRRTFIQLSVVSTAVATGLTGCKNEAIWRQEATGQYGGMSDKVYPYVNQPGATIDGLPTYYATTCQMCPAGCGIYVRTLGGRANKIEGNPSHPVNAGKTCLRGQLALQHLYNPDRVMKPLLRSGRSDLLAEASWDDALDRVELGLKQANAKVALLVDDVTVASSPMKLSLIKSLAEVVKGQVVSYSLFDDSPAKAASMAIYGRDQYPDYRIDLADLVVSFGANFLEAWPSPVYYGRLFGEFRQGQSRTAGSHGQFVYVGPRLSMTAAKADTWLPCRGGTEGIVARGVLNLLGDPSGVPVELASEASGLTVQQIVDLASKLKSAGKRSVVMGGEGLFAASTVTDSYAAVERINIRTGSECVHFGDAESSYSGSPNSFKSITELVSDMSHGKIGALLTFGAVNPAFTLPSSLNWAEAVAKVSFVASIASFVDETAASADVVLASRSFLEEWGDFTPSVVPGETTVTSITQPVIDPVYITKRHDVNLLGNPVQMMDTRETSDIVLDLIRRVGKPLPYGSALDYFRSFNSKDGVNFTDSNYADNPGWAQLVSNGGRWSKASGDMKGARPQASVLRGLPTPSPASGQFSLILYQHLYFGDGRSANLGWAQEMPDPMTSAVWNNWVEINQSVAHSLGIRTGDIVRVTSSAGSIELPAVPYPGIRPDAIAVPIGQGHTSYGRYATSVGVNPLAILETIQDPVTGALALSASLVTIAKVASAVDGYHPELNTLVLVQDRPGGAEPPAVKDLIHETAREWRNGANSSNPLITKETRSKPVI